MCTTSPLDFATGADHSVMKNALELAFREGRPTSYEVYVEPLQKWYHSLVGPIRRGDAVTHLSVLTRDISSEKSAQAHGVAFHRPAAARLAIRGFLAIRGP